MAFNYKGFIPEIGWKLTLQGITFFFFFPLDQLVLFKHFLLCGLDFSPFAKGTAPPRIPDRSLLWVLEISHGEALTLGPGVGECVVKGAGHWSILSSPALGAELVFETVCFVWTVGLPKTNWMVAEDGSLLGTLSFVSQPVPCPSDFF